MDINQVSVGSGKPTEISPQVRTFLDGLLDDAGIRPLDDLHHEEMVKELFARLDQYITAVILDALPPEYMEEFVAMSEQGKPMKEINAFVEAHVPNAQDVLTKALADFRQEYLGGVATSRAAADVSELADSVKASPVATT